MGALKVLIFAPALLFGQDVRPKDVRDTGRQGSAAIPKLAEFLRSPDVDVRIEAVKALTEIGTAASLDPLIQATRDNDPEVQIRATDGLVNFYLPGYVRTGLGATIRRFGASIKARFTEVNDQVIDTYVKVRPEVIQALGKLARGGASVEARANAARALGILRGRGAEADLIDALHSKDDAVIYESLIALQKIRDESAAPKIAFLLRDLNEKVQIAAIETTGLLQNKEALPELTQAFERARSAKVRRAALTAIAMLPDPKNHDLYIRYLQDRDDGLRGAAAEGLGRLRNPADIPALEKAFEDERKASPRLSMAFALVMLGKTDLDELGPLRLLVNTLNSSAHSGEALPLLVELARNPILRGSLYPLMEQGTRSEKIGLARVLARSGDEDSIAPLEKLSRDPDAEVAQEALRASQNLKARLH